MQKPANFTFHVLWRPKFRNELTPPIDQVSLSSGLVEDTMCPQGRARHPCKVMSRSGVSQKLPINLWSNFSFPFHQGTLASEKLELGGSAMVFSSMLFLRDRNNSLLLLIRSLHSLSLVPLLSQWVGRYDQVMQRDNDPHDLAHKLFISHSTIDCAENPEVFQPFVYVFDNNPLAA